MSHKIFDNDLVAICRSKVTLTLNKPACIRMCILELSKVLIYEFHYDYIKNKYGNNSKLLFTDTDSLIYEIKTEDVYKDFSNDKEMFDFSNYSTKSKYYDNSNRLVVVKMKDETAGPAIKEFVGLKPGIYLYSIDDNSERKKAKGAKINVVATISHNEYKYVLLKKTCLRHSINTISSKDHRIGAYKINKIYLSCFDDKNIYSKQWLFELIIKKNSNLNSYLEKLFCQANSFNFQYNQDSYFTKYIKFKKSRNFKNK